MRLRTNARKLWRYCALYGPGRTLFKVAGRLRTALPIFALKRARPDIGVIGCGQFAFATIGYFLLRRFGRRIAACYDIDQPAQQSFERAFRVANRVTDAGELFAITGLRTVYIASNHASHADYAVEAIRRSLDVYIEKPIAVNEKQLVALLRAMRQSRSRVYAGYNRPFSEAMNILRREITLDPSGGFSVQCFVSGHKIAPDHWYRQPAEGTRVCGNLGHWLDLVVHILSWRSMPDLLRVSVIFADAKEPDDNMMVGFSSDRGDICSIMLTSRSEPFEGINETINLQHATTICKIDDFRRMTIWKGERLIRRRFWPKDVGHGRGVLQPYESESPRNWEEVVHSTLLMLHITNMIQNRCTTSTFSFREASEILAKRVELE